MQAEQIEALKKKLDDIAAVRAIAMREQEQFRLWNENGSAKISEEHIQASKQHLTNTEAELFRTLDEMLGKEQGATDSLTNRYLSLDETERAKFFDESLTIALKNIEDFEGKEMEMERKNPTDPEHIFGVDPTGQEAAKETVFGDLDDLLSDAERRSNPQGQDKEFATLEEAVLEKAGISKQDYDKMSQAMQAETIEKAMNRIRDQVIETGQAQSFTFKDENGKTTTLTIAPQNPAFLDPNGQDKDGDSRVDYYKDNDRMHKNEFVGMIKNGIARGIGTSIVHAPGKLKGSLDRTVDQALQQR